MEIWTGGGASLFCLLNSVCNCKYFPSIHHSIHFCMTQPVTKVSFDVRVHRSVVFDLGNVGLWSQYLLKANGLCFFQNAALQHLFIRKSFRPFKCLQCGKAFREKDKLDQHLRFHGREGNCPLTCDICNKGFINSGSLESHMKFHMDQKTYSCIFCPESFDRLDLLKDHVAIHIIDGYFTCPTCKKRFPDFIQVRCCTGLKPHLWDLLHTLYFFPGAWISEWTLVNIFLKEKPQNVECFKKWRAVSK